MIPAFTALLALATTTVAAATLSARQNFDETWNDLSIPEPINFEIRNAGAQCNFQLVYERYSQDNRYSIDYIAEYADGSQTKVNGLSGTLARDNLWLVDGEANDRGYQVVFFQDICSSGTAPSSFRVIATLKGGFTYENNWTSGSFKITSGSLPGNPRNVRLSSSKNSSTVTWDPVQGASGYVAFVRWLVDSELGPDSMPYVSARELGADAISFTYDRDFTSASVVAIGGSVAFTPLDVAYDVTPS